MTTSLVTGGAGFIGSHLCERLLAEGHKVICMDSLITGKTRNIKHLHADPNFTYIKHDISKPLELREDIDYIFHFASPASPIDYQEEPVKTILSNSYGTFNLLTLAKQKDSKLLLASTSEVYGDPLVHPQPETYWGNVNPNGVRSCYDESKRLGEAMVMAFVRRYGTDARIIRIFNTYGERMRLDDGRVIPNFITQCIKNEPITIYGDGMQTRSLCYVGDLVAGICKVMFDAKKGEVFNLGNPTEYTMIELAKEIKELTDSESEFVFKPLPTDDPMQRRPDITKIKNELGWEPKVTPNEGLKKTIEWFRKEMQNNENYS